MATLKEMRKQVREECVSLGMLKASCEQQGWWVIAGEIGALLPKLQGLDARLDHEQAIAERALR